MGNCGGNTNNNKQNIPIQEDSPDHIFKVVLIGEISVGKSSILVRYVNDDFDENGAEVSLDFLSKTLDIDKEVVKMNIWDTAGQERFKTLTASFFRGSDGCVIVFDLCSNESFQNVRLWMKELERFTQPSCVKYLVGNKSDLPERTVTHEDAQQLAIEYGIVYYETSAKNGTNIDTLFEDLAKEMKRKK